MSMAALLSAVRSTLQTVGQLNRTQCDILADDGLGPPAIAADSFIAIDEVGVDSTEKSFLRETYRINIVIWKRTGKYANDRRGDILLDIQKGLDVLERFVIQNIHNSQIVRAAANTALTTLGIGGDIFEQPLFYTGRGSSRPAASGPSEKVSTWICRELPFSGAVRNQSMANMK